MQVWSIWQNKTGLIPSRGCVKTIVWMHHTAANKKREKARWELHKNAISYLEQILEATLHETRAVQPHTSHLKNIQVRRIRHTGRFGEARTNSSLMFFYGSLHIDVPVLADLQELIYIRSVQTQDVVLKTCLEQRIIGRVGERESGKYMQSLWLDDDDDDDDHIALQ